MNPNATEGKNSKCQFTASVNLQKAIENVLRENIKNMTIYQDDIYLVATNKEEIS